MTRSSALALFVSDLVGAVLGPEQCAACEAVVPFRTIFCRECAGTLVPAYDGPPDASAPFQYGGAVAQAITRFKYGRRPDLARPLGALLLRGVSHLTSRPDVVVPVPLHPSRLAERGFNQAALLAGPVARFFGARLEPRALARERATAVQATLDRHARAKNVAGAFRVRRPDRVVGRSVLLVDDVRTTGSTLAACTKALEASGARRVLTAVVAAAGEPTT